LDSLFLVFLIGGPYTCCSQHLRDEVAAAANSRRAFRLRVSNRHRRENDHESNRRVLQFMIVERTDARTARTTQTPAGAPAPCYLTSLSLFVTLAPCSQRPAIALPSTRRCPWLLGLLACFVVAGTE